MKIDRLFTENAALFGEKPSPLIIGLMRYLPPDALVLDVGAGQGRNTLALAQAGFRVEAVDPSSAGLRQLAEQAERLGLSGIETRSGSVLDLPFDRVYNGVCLINVLHYLPPEQVRDVIMNCQRATAVGGVHVLSVLTKGTDTALLRPDSLTPDLPEVEAWYAGWEMIDSRVVPGESARKDSQGKPYQTQAVRVVARKRV
ncbi:methyltransferase domain-containing protein [Patescibacteria group bacterium]|nr:methyltransferase domain-containing protein [Patescibacteria group bacterium]